MIFKKIIKNKQTPIQKKMKTSSLFFKKFTKSTLPTLLALIATYFFFPQKIQAQTGPQVWTEGLCQISGVATIQGFGCLVANVLSVTLTIIGLVGFIMMIVGSMKWLLSGGNTQNVESARKTMTWAVVGLGVALSSFVIINLIAQFTGVNVITEFFIPSSNTGLPGHTQWEDLGR